MNPNQKNLNQTESDQKADGSISRRAIAKKVAYVAPAVLAVIAIGERPALAASTIQPG